jgi:hypothetical protein
MLIRHAFLLWIAFSLILSGCDSSNGREIKISTLPDSSKVQVEYFIIPRNADYDPFYNRVYEYGLQKHTVYTLLKDRRYETRTKKDSIAAYFYIRKEENILPFKKMVASLVPPKLYKSNETPSILLAFSLPDGTTIDTIGISPDEEIIYNGKQYAPDSTLMSALGKIMPEELWDNWKNDLPVFINAIAIEPRKARHKHRRH